MSRRLVLVVVLLTVLSATPAYAFWSSLSASGGTGAGRATTMNAGSTPTAVASGTSVSLSWAATTTASGAAVTGYLVRRYDATSSTLQTTGTGCSGTVSGTSCTETAVPEGSWTYAVVPVLGGSWRGAEGARSGTVVVDVTAPTNGITLNQVSGGSSRSGGALYYRGVAAGSFKGRNAVADAGSGPASSSTTSRSGDATGWTHTPSTVSTPSGGPFVSGLFSWAAGTTSSPTESVTGRDVAGNTTTATFTLVNDSMSPTGGSISSTHGYLSSRSTTVTFTAPTDSGSGVTGTVLQRASATLSGGTCGSFGAFANIGTANPTSPYTDTALANSTCYQYQLATTDAVGNVATIQSASTAEVDYGQAVLSTAGLVSFWRLSDAVRTLTAITTDSFPGTAGATLQSRTGQVGATWTKHAVSDTDAVLTTSGRIRKGGANTRAAVYYSSGSPSTADYSVSADLYLISDLATDDASVLGRVSSSVATFYSAGWDSGTDSWRLLVLVNGTPTVLGSSTSQPLSVGGNARVTLDMLGTTIRVLVGGTPVITVISSAVTDAGRAGVELGGADDGSATTVTGTTGLHVDNLSATSGSTAATDSAGTNTGTYYGGPSASSDTPLGADPDAASSFDGVDDAVFVASPSGVPAAGSARSVELWMKASSADTRYLFSYGPASGGQELVLRLAAGGTLVTLSNGTRRTFAPTSSVTDGAWHHMVMSDSGSSLVLYLDGAAMPLQNTTPATIGSDPGGLSIGAQIQTAGSPPQFLGFYTGLLDEVSVYNQALTAAQAAAHYQLGTGR